MDVCTSQNTVNINREKNPLLLGIEPLKGCTAGKHVILGLSVNRTDRGCRQNEARGGQIYVNIY